MDKEVARPLRTVLFVPGSDEAALEAAPGHGADAIAIDIEEPRNDSGPIRYGDANQGEGHVVHLAHVGSARMNLEWARALGLA